MTSRFNKCIKEKDRSDLINRPVSWLLSRYMGHFLWPTIGLEVLLGFFLPLETPVYTVTIISAAVAIGLLLLILRRLFIYFNFRLGTRRLSRAFAFCSLYILLLSFSFLVIPVIFNLRLEQRIASSPGATDDYEQKFKLQMNQVYLHYLQRQSKAISVLTDTVSLYDSYVFEDSTIVQSKIRQTQYHSGEIRLKSELVRISEEFENSFGYYWSDSNVKGESSDDRIRQILSVYNLQEPDLDKDNAIDIVKAELVRRQPLVYYSSEELASAQFSGLVMQLAKCLYLQREIKNLARIVEFDAKIFIMLQILTASLISILVFCICMWKAKVFIGFSLVVTIVFVVSAVYAIVQEFFDDETFFLLISIPAMMFAVYSLQTRIHGKRKTLKLTQLIISNFIAFAAPVIIAIFILDSADFMDSWSKERVENFIIALIAIHFMIMIVIQHWFIRKYLELYFSPGSSLKMSFPKMVM
jgi:hypothetical protein